MRTAKVFKCGNSQAIRLPKDFQFNSNEVEILKRGEEIIIRNISRQKKLLDVFELFSKLPDDFFSETRIDSLPQEREAL